MNISQFIFKTHMILKKKSNILFMAFLLKRLYKVYKVKGCEYAM